MSEITSDIERYTRLLERDPDSRVFAPLAEACRKANRLQEALEIARAGVERHPTYASGRVALARAQLSLEHYDEAAGELEQAIAHAPENALAYRLLGEVRKSLGQHGAAFEAFARALALNPEDGEARDAVAMLEQEATAAVAPEHPPPAFEEMPGYPAPEAPESLAPEAGPPPCDAADLAAPAAAPVEEIAPAEIAPADIEAVEVSSADAEAVAEVAPADDAPAETETEETEPAEAEDIWPLSPGTADTHPAESVPPDLPPPAPFEAAQPAADEIRLTDEITGHEYDEELPGPIAGETAGGAGASELDLALEPLGESDASPGEPAEAPDDSQARAPVEPELPLPGAPAPDFGPAFGPDGLAGTDRDSRASVTPAELGEEEGDAGAIYSVDAGESFHPDEALPGGDVPLEHFLDNLDIGQSSLAPEARENTAAGFSGEGAPKEEPPDAASSTGSAIPLDGRVEELADQYRAQGQLHRARALYRALLEGNEMNLGVRSKLEELGEEPQLSPQGPPPHDRMVREKVEENIDSLNRWLANIKRGAAR